MNFWMTRALSESGIGVHVVTNANEVEEDFRIFDVARYDPDRYFSLPLTKNLTVHQTEFDDRQSHIPWSNPFVTKIASKATEIVTKFNCDLIHAFYFEPYGMAAYLTSKWTGIPYGLQHAGTDIGRLYSNEQLTHSYRHIIKEADYLIHSQQMRNLTSRLSIDMERLYSLSTAPPPPEYYNPEAQSLDIQNFLSIINNSFSQVSSLADIYTAFADKDFESNVPSIGLYGKLGERKGWRELIPALGLLKKSGVDFNFLILGQSRRKNLIDFQAKVEAHDIFDRTYLLPFIPHWHVPHFIRACSLICVLENRFPIQFHTPSLPLEVVSCGTCLLMSNEIAAKHLLNGKIVSGHNCFVVDPTDLASLVSAVKQAIKDPERLREIGLQGRSDFSNQEEINSFGTRLCSQFIKILKEVNERKKFTELRDGVVCLNTITKNRQLDFHSIDRTVEELKNKYKQERIHHILKCAKQAYRNTFRLYGDKARECFHNFYEGLSDIYNLSTVQIILRFGEYLLGCIGSLSPQLNYAIDLLNYEKQFYFLLHRDCLPKRRSNSSIEIQPGDKLIHSKFIEFIKVEHDVPEIIYSLKKSSESMKYLQASKFYVGSAWLVFKRIYLDESEPEVLFISNETKTVIELCTGLDTAKSISQKVRQQLYYRGEDKDIYNILDRLLARDCIEFMGKETPA